MLRELHLLLVGHDDGRRLVGDAHRLLPSMRRREPLTLQLRLLLPLLLVGLLRLVKLVMMRRRVVVVVAIGCLIELLLLMRMGMMEACLRSVDQVLLLLLLEGR